MNKKTEEGLNKTTDGVLPSIIRSIIPPRSTSAPRSIDPNDRLADFIPVGNGIYANEATREIGIRLVITYSDNDKLWSYYQEHCEELESLVRDKVNKINKDLVVQEIIVTRGSIILTVIAFLAVYSQFREMVKDVEAHLPLIKRGIEKFFNQLATNGLRGLFGPQGPQLNAG